MERFLNGDVEKSVIEPKKFTDQAREDLLKRQLVIYSLTGKSLEDMLNDGEPMYPTWFRDYECGRLPSIVSEVAFDPTNPFIKDSNNKTLAEQLEMIKKYSDNLPKGRKRIRDSKAIMGQAPDYAQLAFSHLRATEQELFGVKHDYQYARTQSPPLGFYVASVGRFVVKLNVDLWYSDFGYDEVRALPLIVPA